MKMKEVEWKKGKQLIGHKVVNAKLLYNGLDSEFILVFDNGKKLTWGFENYEGSTEVENAEPQDYDATLTEEKTNE